MKDWVRDKVRISETGWGCDWGPEEGGKRLKYQIREKRNGRRLAGDIESLLLVLEIKIFIGAN